MSESLRQFLLNEIRQFVESASQLDGLSRIALVGSLVTEKENPKDADILITISESTDIDSLVALGRKLKGHAQSRNSGARWSMSL